MSEEKRHAFITLVATDGYASGALVLARALREYGTTKEIACLITCNISSDTENELSQVFDHLYEVPALNSQSYENLLLLGRLDLGITLTKIYLWELVQYEKVVFLDADTLPLRNVDELFERPEFAAAPDSGWPDCFNSGVFVAKPSHATYNGLYKMAKETGSFDGGDQGLLNTYFSDWSTSGQSHRLPFTYNTTPTAVYSYRPAYKVFHSNVSIIHFIGSSKPWHWTKFSDGKLFPKGNASPGLVDLVQKWWDVWEKYYGNASPVRNSRYDVPHMSSNPQAVRFSASQYASVWGNEKDIFTSVSDCPVAPMPPLSVNSVDVESAWSAPHDISVWVDAPPVIEQHYQAPAPPTPPQAPSHDNEHGHIDWNPAYEGPPVKHPLVVDIPSFGRYSNAWDQPFRRKAFAPKYNPSMSPPAQIHQIFPWEQNNHNNSKPSRVWLDEEEEERKEFEAAAAAAAAATAATAAQGRRDSGYNEPGRDESRFVNAWDVSPSMSKFLARLYGEDVADRKAVAISMANMRIEAANQRDSSDPTAKHPGDYWETSHQKKETKPSSSAPFGRTKSQMFANQSKTGPTPYTSAATTPTAELPPHHDDELEDIVPPGKRTSDHANDLDIYPVDWASDLKRAPQDDYAATSTKTVNRPREGFDVTPSISPPRVSPSEAPSSYQRHHFRSPSERSVWNPDEALYGVRRASLIFGGLEGGEAARNEEERLGSYYHDEENEDLGVLGMRVDRSQKDEVAKGNNVILTDEELLTTAGGVEDKLDPRQGSLFLRRASKEDPLYVDKFAAPVYTPSVLDKLDFTTSTTNPIVSELVKTTEESDKDNSIMAPAEEDTSLAATALEKENAIIEALDAGELKARLKEVQHITTTEPSSQTLKLTTVETGVDPRPIESREHTFFAEIREDGNAEVVTRERIINSAERDPASTTTTTTTTATIFRSSSPRLQSTSTFTTTAEGSSTVEEYDVGSCHVAELELEVEDEEDEEYEESDEEVAELYGNRISFESLDIDEE